MVNTSSISKDMPVYASDGTDLGRVDDVGPQHIKLTRKDFPDGRHHLVPISWVERVDAHVHLNRTAGEVLALDDGAERMAAVAPAAAAKARSPWVWLVAAAVALLLMFLLARSCTPEEDEVTRLTPEAATPAATTTTTTATRTVTLPDGRTVEVASGSMNESLQTYLAGSEAAPRTFTFDNLNFDTGSSAIRAADQPTLNSLAQILGAYPGVKARVAGYADNVGDAAANQGLGAARANAVVAALTAQGVARDRLEAVTGGESDPVATNATGAGRAENRRTDLIITSR